MNGPFTFVTTYKLKPGQVEMKAIRRGSFDSTWAQRPSTHSL